jgi:hypothetical protein
MRNPLFPSAGNGNDVTDKSLKLKSVKLYVHNETEAQKTAAATCLLIQNVIFHHPVALYRADFGTFVPSMFNVVHYSFFIFLYWTLQVSV